MNVCRKDESIPTRLPQDFEEVNMYQDSLICALLLLRAPCLRSQKVIGCRYFYDGVGGPQKIKQLWPGESISCRYAHHTALHLKKHCTC
jgi:hypothetical protein